MYLLVFSILILTISCKREPEDLRIKQIGPDEAKQFASTIEGLVSPELDERLQVKLWASDSLVFDPISIDFDDKGRLYYSRTNRQKNSEIEIRRFPQWEIPSISLQSISDKRAFLREELSPERSEHNKWMPDLNNDGSHDWKDMTVEKEHIYRLEDTDGDGLADKYQLVVQDFHEEVTDVAGAVLKFEDDLFVGVGPDMWRITEDEYGLASEKQSISHGYAIHIGFGAHGMSGAEIGPDGRVYWGIGDVGFHGEDQEGNTWKYPNRGVIARSNPDGSDFEIFAMGVRNTHEFVFDEFGNLISVDNDGDHQGERERLVYLVDGSDTGWRINWQFGKYRDPNNNTYKVWMDEDMHTPRTNPATKAAYYIPPIANYVNGPTGMLYNPGTALGPEWKNNFFVAEFVGNPARSGIHAFKLEPKGAGFELAETKKIMGGILATGMDFAPDGSLYFADWIDGWGTKGYGRIWKLLDSEGQNWEARKTTEALMGQDFESMEDDELEAHLGNEDQRIRRKAQFALAKRGEKGFELFKSQLAQKQNRLARVHAIWGISQLARKDLSKAEALLPYLKDEDGEIRAQAARWIGDVRYADAGEQLMTLLDDEYDRARFFAAEALGRTSHAPAISKLIDMLEKNDDEDVYLRHAGSLALARIGDEDAVMKLKDHPSRAVRIAAVVALRRMEYPGVAEFLKDKDEYIVAEAARAINDDFSIPDALPALGKTLEEDRFKSEPLIRRAINANLRLGTEEAMEALLAYAIRPSAPRAMREEAIAALGTWAQPSVLDRVDGRYRGEVTRDPALVRQASSKRLMDLLSNSDPAIRVAAANALGKLEVKDAAEPLFARLKSDPTAEVREVALKALVAINWENNDQAIETALADREKQVRVAGLDLMERLEVDQSLLVELLVEVIQKRTIEERQAAMLTLGKVDLTHSKEAFEQMLAQVENGELAPEVELELSEALEEAEAQDLLTQYENIKSELTEGELLASYRGSLYGGDVDRGRNIFVRHQTGQCIRCHAYDDYGGNAGPRMNGIAEILDRQELLEALIDPSKRLAPGFGVVTLTLQDEQTVSGILAEENAQSLAVKMGNKPDTVIMKTDVAERKDALSSMPDMKGLLNRREIRDLVSFLATLKEDDYSTY
nr:HEAT repeat domain-containing protein [Pleomorphovibrio marinus]